MLRSTDPLRGENRRDANWAIAHVDNLAGVRRRDDVADYLRELYRLAEAVDLDAAILVAQSALETGNWASNEWANQLNPAAIGKGDLFDVGLTYQNGEEAARAHVVHMYAYVYGRISPDHALAPFIVLDPRYAAVLAAGWDGSVGQLFHLTGKWASDPRYDEKIVERARVVLPDFPDHQPPARDPAAPITFGLVPHPPYQRRIVENAGWDDRGPRTPVGTCVHRMQGTLMGTDGYFRNPNDKGWFALTDYGIGGAPERDYGNGLDGVIFMWNDPVGRKTPWANGWNLPSEMDLEGDGIAFNSTYGRSAINRDLVSIELSGYYVEPIDGVTVETEVTEKQLESLCQLVAYWHDQARVPWDRFPVNPATNVITQLQHFEFARKGCPGRAVRDLTDRYQERARQIMREYQTRQGTGGGPTGGFAKPSAPPPPPFTGADLTINGHVFHAVPPAQQAVTSAVDGLNCRKWASTSAPLVRAPLMRGEGFVAHYWVEGENVDGESRWWVTSFGTRIWCGGTDKSPDDL